tara:strand:+ start:56 stop:241 length:186 start_codon:yes stop_codon:yes gene_type:complete
MGIRIAMEARIDDLERRLKLAEGALEDLILSNAQKETSTHTSDKLDKPTKKKVSKKVETTV